MLIFNTEHPHILTFGITPKETLYIGNMFNNSYWGVFDERMEELVSTVRCAVTDISFSFPVLCCNPLPNHTQRVHVAI